MWCARVEAGDAPEDDTVLFGGFGKYKISVEADTMQILDVPVLQG